MKLVNPFCPSVPFYFNVFDSSAVIVAILKNIQINGNTGTKWVKGFLASDWPEMGQSEAASRRCTVKSTFLKISSSRIGAESSSNMKVSQSSFKEIGKYFVKCLLLFEPYLQRCIWNPTESFLRHVDLLFW